MNASCVDWHPLPDFRRVLDYMPVPCGGATCADPRCLELAELRTQIAAAGDRHARLVASYENKASDFARETLRADRLQSQLALAKKLAEAAGSILAGEGSMYGLEQALAAFQGFLNDCPALTPPAESR